MSLLKALHAATTLAAVKDLLATQVLTTEDLATADVYDLTQALRDKGAAPTVFTVEDVTDSFDGTPAEAADWLVRNRSRLDDVLAQRGNEWIADALQMDGKWADAEDDDDADGVEALIYGDAGHPSRIRDLNPGDIDYLKSVGYTVNHRGEGWVFNDPDGNDDTSVFTLQTTAWIAAKRDEATRPAPGDDLWTLKRDGQADVTFNTYAEAFDVANSGDAIPFRIIPPLAERDPDTDYGEG